MLSFHPLIGSLSERKTEELESKVVELTNKYGMTTNPSIREQIVVILNSYRDELSLRRAKELASMEDSAKVRFNDLINVE